ncbi:MAG: hypothetical protein PHR77_16135 [Kiritimatiellae bacterium]|nr:hypothetical protein [Kiritimatiellia bacterium]MDD5523406.1 hypothetical protein [Kiritimatiellia bacterium]
MSICSIQVVFFVLAISLCRVMAGPIGIANPSFENPVLPDNTASGTTPGWSGGPSVAIVNPIFSDFTGVDGQNVLSVDGSDTASQILSTNLTANRLYVLQVNVGNRLVPTGFGGYKVQFLAGGVLLAEESSLQPADRQFLTSEIRYYSYSYDSHLGAPLEIRLLSVGDNVGYDNVRLDESWIPDPTLIRDMSWSSDTNMTLIITNLTLGATNVVQRTYFLDSPMSWHDVTSFVSSGYVTNWTMSGTLSNSAFYRVTSR